MYKTEWGEERKPRYKYDSNAKMLGLCVTIAVYKSLNEKNTRTEKMKERVKRALQPMHGVQLGSLRPHTRASCCSDNKQFAPAAE